MAGAPRIDPSQPILGPDQLVGGSDVAPSLEDLEAQRQRAGRFVTIAVVVFLVDGIGILLGYYLDGTLVVLATVAHAFLVEIGMFMMGMCPDFWQRHTRCLPPGSKQHFGGGSCLLCNHQLLTTCSAAVAFVGCWTMGKFVELHSEPRFAHKLVPAVMAVQNGVQGTGIFTTLLVMCSVYDLWLFVTSLYVQHVNMPSASLYAQRQRASYQRHLLGNRPPARVGRQLSSYGSVGGIGVARQSSSGALSVGSPTGPRGYGGSYGTSGGSLSTPVEASWAGDAPARASPGARAAASRTRRGTTMIGNSEARNAELRRAAAGYGAVAVRDRVSPTSSAWPAERPALRPGDARHGSWQSLEEDTDEQSQRSLSTSSGALWGEVGEQEDQGGDER